jgi:hypothetical protein
MHTTHRRGLLKIWQTLLLALSLSLALLVAAPNQAHAEPNATPGGLSDVGDVTAGPTSGGDNFQTSQVTKNPCGALCQLNVTGISNLLCVEGAGGRCAGIVSCFDNKWNDDGVWRYGAVTGHGPSENEAWSGVNSEGWDWLSSHGAHYGGFEPDLYGGDGGWWFVCLSGPKYTDSVITCYRAGAIRVYRPNLSNPFAMTATVSNNIPTSGYVRSVRNVNTCPGAWGVDRKVSIKSTLGRYANLITVPYDLVRVRDYASGGVWGPYVPSGFVYRARVGGGTRSAGVQWTVRCTGDGGSSIVGNENSNADARWGDGNDKDVYNPASNPNCGGRGWRCDPNEPTLNGKHYTSFTVPANGKRNKLKWVISSNGLKNIKNESTRFTVNPNSSPRLAGTTNMNKTGQPFQLVGQQSGVTTAGRTETLQARFLAASKASKTWNLTTFWGMSGTGEHEFSMPAKVSWNRANGFSWDNEMRTFNIPITTGCSDAVSVRSVKTRLVGN